MKVEVIKSFVSGRYAGTKGETPDMPDEVARYLAEIGFVAPVQPEEAEPEEKPKEPEKQAPKRTKRS